MMKTKLFFLTFAFAAALAADTLKTDTAVFAQTDPKSPVLARLKAGATVTVVGEAPAGWRRVEIEGPFEAYAKSRDITKGLEVRDGGNIYAAPRKDAQLLAVAAPGDKSEVIGLAGGDWVQVKLEKKLQGFIAVGEAANIAADPKPVAPITPAPATPTGPVTTVGRPVAMSGNTADTPRLFAGTLVLARRPILNPNPPYDYQLTDSNGRRFAYVDTKRLLLTDRIENFLDRDISVTGTVRNTVDGKDLVIAAESMSLKK
jgi:antitoxin (DNA-binding transcriptional repressor) of toxin-antitoxin stability system